MRVFLLLLLLVLPNIGVLGMGVRGDAGGRRESGWEGELGWDQWAVWGEVGVLMGKAAVCLQRSCQDEFRDDVL